MHRWVCEQELLRQDFGRPRVRGSGKSLTYAVTPKRLPVTDIVRPTVTESACRPVTSDESQELQAKMINMVNKHD